MGEGGLGRSYDINYTLLQHHKPIYKYTRESERQWISNICDATMDRNAAIASEMSTLPGKLLESKQRHCKSLSAAPIPALTFYQPHRSSSLNPSLDH